MNNILKWATTREPAAVGGALIGVVDIVYEVVVGHPGQSWHALLPLIAGALIRHYVTPTGKPPAMPAGPVSVTKP